MSIFFFLLLSLNPVQAKSAPAIVISAVAITGGAGKSSDDFVELSNTEGDCLDISGWQIRKKSSSGSESSVAVLPKDTFISPHDTYVWADSKGAWAGSANHTTSATLAADNSVALYTKSGSEGKLIDSVSWGKGEPFDEHAQAFDDNPGADEALTRDTGGNWEKDFHKPDPRIGSACTPKAAELPPLLPIPVHLSEIFANPKGDEHQEFIELFNQSDSTFDLSGYIIKDASQTGHYIFPEDTRLSARSFLLLTRDTFKFALNNSGEVVSLLDPYARELEKVSLGKTKESVSLSQTGSGWRGTSPTPGAPNEDSSLPSAKEKVPKIGYLDTPVSFTAEPKKKSKKLKYVWDFGDGHKSYLPETTHTYAKKGKYVVLLTVSDQKNDSVEHFNIEIESFPKYDAEIVRLAPNPAGRDTENEWLDIKNNEKKPLDLYGWSIATGTQEPVNHPIRTHLKIAAGATLKLTHADALFSLPNREAVIELRLPNHKTIQSIRYALATSLPEGALYELTPAGWQWSLSLEQNTRAKTASREPAFDTSISLTDDEQKLREESPVSKAAEEKMTALLTFQASERLSAENKHFLQAPPFPHDFKQEPAITLNSLLNRALTAWTLSRE